MAPTAPKPFGTYALLKALGQGAMGDVQLARPFNPNRGIPTPCVIKRLHGELANDEDFVRRFKHEASIAVSIDSPHVAKVYDVGCVDETLYITMEYVPGWPLSKFLESVINSGRHASIASIVDMVAGGIRGLGALHTAKDTKTGQPLGVVHRDISPKNLMVGDDGLMRLIDLGLGKSNLQDWKTRTGIVMGSVGYMPPEQVTAEAVDHRADLYAMGVVLYETIALRNFVKRGPIPQMLRASLKPEWRPPSEFRPDVPPGLDEVIQKCVAPEPEDRYNDADELLAALREVVPPDKSKGGTAKLIKELFGDAEAERRNEIRALLDQPLPEVEDGPEIEKTIVFVQRDDVAPVQEQDFAPTRMAPHPSLSGPGQPVSAYSGPYGVNPNFPMDPASMTGPDGAPVSPYQTHTLAVGRGVSVPMAIGLMIGSAALAAAGVFGYLQYEKNQSAGAETVVVGQSPQDAPPPAAKAKLGVTVKDRPTVTLEEPRPAAVPDKPTKRVRRRTKRTEPAEIAKATPPKPTPPKPAAPGIEPTKEGVDKEAKRLLARAKQLATKHPEKKAELNGLRAAISQEQYNPNKEKAARGLKRIRRKLAKIASE